MNKENLEKLLINIADSRSVIAQAINGRSEAIEDGLRLFGKKGKARWIRSLVEPGDHRRYAFQESYKRIIGGWYFGCRQGAELLITDLEIYLRDLRLAFLDASAASEARFGTQDNSAVRQLILIRNTVNQLLGTDATLTGGLI